MSRYTEYSTKEELYEAWDVMESAPVPEHIFLRAKKIQKVFRIIIGCITVPPLIIAFVGLLVVIWTGGHGGWILGVAGALVLFVLFCMYDAYVLTPIHRAKRNGTIDE